MRVYREAYLAATDTKTPSEQKQITARLLSRLVRDRVLPRAGQLEKDVRRAYMKRAGRADVTVESASKLQSDYRHELMRMFGKDALIREAVNPELLAGIRILVDDELLIDATGRKVMSDMFTPLERGRRVAKP